MLFLPVQIQERKHFVARFKSSRLSAAGLDVRCFVQDRISMTRTPGWVTTPCCNSTMAAKLLLPLLSFGMATLVFPPILIRIATLVLPPLLIRIATLVFPLIWIATIVFPLHWGWSERYRRTDKRNIFCLI